MIYFINWQNFIIWLPLLLDISENICILIIFYPVCDDTNFEIYFSFLIKPFFIQPDQNLRTKTETF